MSHCNNCTNEINAWAKVFKGFLEALGQKPDMNAVFTAMFESAAKGAADGGGLLLYNYLSGEPITGMEEGRPLLCRAPEGELSFPNLMRAQLLSALATLKIGLDIWAGSRWRWTGCWATAASSRPPRWRQSIWPRRRGPRCPSWRPPARAAPGAWPCWPPTGWRRGTGSPWRTTWSRTCSPAPGVHPGPGAGRRGRLRGLHGPLPQGAGHRALRRGQLGITPPERAYLKALLQGVPPSLSRQEPPLCGGCAPKRACGRRQTAE